jgi:2-polyprenyl-6-methoxyphenol hydroxylase-like FAD-dependent oxidoreductase
LVSDQEVFMDDVVIVGAGPTGLWLAGELRLGGAAVTVLETRAERDPNSKALTIHPRTIEILDCRGLAGAFLAEGARIPSGHFAGLPSRMDFAVLDTPHPYTLALPQARTEELLEVRAREMGATIRRGHRVTGLAPNGVELDGGEIVPARYVVGCDGVRSTVRAAAGIGFPGIDATMWGWLGDVVLDAPPERGIANYAGPRGGLLLLPMGGGVFRLAGSDPSNIRPGWPGELRFEELRSIVEHIAGTDFGMRDPVWLSRFGNATRQATTYRQGNVLLAGDAAHQHFPAGGVGMNVGIQDAHNLGWKLAAVVTGSAGDELLDTYHSERHPVGAALIDHTRAQTALMTAYSEEGRALRALLSRLIESAPDMSRQLAEQLSGLDVAYATGRRVGNLSFADGTTLFERLRTGEHVKTAEGLVRPDGHLA